MITKKKKNVTHVTDQEKKVAVRVMVQEKIRVAGAMVMV